jgi:alpha-L-rhamnosidase
MDHMATFIKDDLMPRDTYGDWCVPPEDASLIHSKDPLRKTDPTILGTTYYFHCCEQMAFYAELLGNPDDARHWRELAARLKTAFNAKFYDPAKGYYDNGSQTSCVLPLALGLVPEGQGARVFGRLVSKITDETKNHVGTGLIGGQWLMRTLTANARTDLAFTLASNTTYPSWGYMVQKGATTIWELWNGDTADPAMNSGNHVMLVGDLILWFHETLAGIQADPARPAFKHIIMRPTPVGDLTHVRATHRSPYGLIVSEWRVEGARGAGGGFAASPVFKWEVTIPANTTATLHLPGTSPAAARESGKPLAQVVGLRVVGKENGRTVVEAEPGRYSFECR